MTSQLTPDELQTIRDELAAGDRVQTIAARYGIAVSTVYKHTAADRQTAREAVAPPIVPAAPAEARRWEDHAACRGLGKVGAELFFPEKETPTLAKAVAYCQACPVTADCLARGMNDHEHGVWGGRLLNAGQIVTPRRRRRAA